MAPSPRRVEALERRESACQGHAVARAQQSQPRARIATRDHEQSTAAAADGAVGREAAADTEVVDAHHDARAEAAAAGIVDETPAEREGLTRRDRGRERRAREPVERALHDRGAEQ